MHIHSPPKLSVLSSSSLLTRTGVGSRLLPLRGRLPETLCFLYTSLLRFLFRAPFFCGLSPFVGAVPAHLRLSTLHPCGLPAAPKTAQQPAAWRYRPESQLRGSYRPEFQLRVGQRPEFQLRLSPLPPATVLNPNFAVATVLNFSCAVASVLNFSSGSAHSTLLALCWPVYASAVHGLILS